MSNESRLMNIKEWLEELNTEYSYQMICKMDEEQKREYTRLLDLFLFYNSEEDGDQYQPNELNRLKGKALEELVAYLFRVSGNIFEVKQNLRTSTNEIDQVFQLTQSGNFLMANGIIDKRYKLFLGECKNYNKAVSVTYVGKFCSLMLSNGVKLGLLFSYHGLSGQGWSNASGLVKKFYLHKENLEDRYCIIDINKDDFIAIKNGNNLLEIISNKMNALQLDTDYEKYISKHPAEG